MNKDKHVLPDGVTFPERIREETLNEVGDNSEKTIYGPDNKPLVNGIVVEDRELIDDGKLV
ncbi:MAG: hypothetical protein ACM3TR_10565 [Caulobacteraceae bacterium]